jgi:hypothetical protein
VSPVKYKLDFYIPEDDILHSRRRENLKSYMCTYVRELHVALTRYIIQAEGNCYMYMHIQKYAVLDKETTGRGRVTGLNWAFSRTTASHT